MLWQWSTTAGNNANVGSINWAEGQAPSTVNNSARQTMADVADYVNNPGPEWYQHDSAAYASGTTFTVSGDQTGYYVAGRRLRAVNAATTIYGAVVSATFSTNTTVTAAWDSGSLDAGLSSLKAGIISPTNLSFPRINLPASGLSVSATVQVAVIIANNQSACYEEFSCSGGAKYAGVSGGNFVIRNSANSASVLTIDDSGNLTAAANITANSDERLKDDWTAMPDDFCERLCYVLSGSFTRTDLVPNQRQLGVGAQSILKYLPEAKDAVMEDENGILSVAYGNLALVACIELAREVRRLRMLLKIKGVK